MKRSQSVRPEIKKAIKSEAKERIENLYPDWKQRNMQAQVQILQDKRITAILSHLGIADPLTTEEAATLGAMRNIWLNEIKAIRDYSDTLEDDVDRSKQVDYTTGWPS